MTRLSKLIVGRGTAKAAALATVAALLAGCNQHTATAQASYPTEIRELHPITLREGDRSVEIFVGRNRG